jgi:hypothetical protein
MWGTENTTSRDQYIITQWKKYLSTNHKTRRRTLPRRQHHASGEENDVHMDGLGQTLQGVGKFAPQCSSGHKKPEQQRLQGVGNPDHRENADDGDD